MKRIITLYLMMLAFVAAANATDYDLIIDGTTVTSSNAEDVKGDGIFKYDATHNSLLIKGSYTSKTSRMIESNIYKLNITFLGDVVLTCNNGPVFLLKKETRLTGVSDKTLTVKSPVECGFYLINGASLAINNTNVDIQALWGIAGPFQNQLGEKLTVNNSNVTITTSGSGAAAICDLMGGLELVDCGILAPEGTYFDVKDLKDKDGNLAKDVTIVRPVAISETNFPDANFRAYVKANCQSDGDDYLTVKEIAAVKKIICNSSISTNKITSLKGIEFFLALNELNCNNNQLTSLDVTKNTQLKSLFAESNQLTSLDVTKNTQLEQLFVTQNQLTSLDVTKNTQLKFLFLTDNKLTSLDVTKNTALTALNTEGNQLTSLDVTKNTALTNLSVASNQLTSLDVSKNTALEILNASYNQLSSIDVTKITNLKDLFLQGNKKLTSLNVTKNTALRKLEVSNNKLTSLDVTKNTALTNLKVSHNRLTSLDVTKNTKLEILDARDNKLTSIDVTKMTNLKELYIHNNQLTSLDVTKNTKLQYLYPAFNKLTSLDASKNTKLVEIQVHENQLTSFVVSDQAANFDRIVCLKNQLDEGAMYNLVKSLPQVTNKVLWVIEEEDGEGNVMTTEEVAMAKEKGWRVQHSILGSPKDYDGTEPTGAIINATNFPDATFRSYVKANCQSNGDEYLTAEEMAAVTVIDVRNKGIAKLNGIERFTALKELYCSQNKLTALDVTKNTQLTRLACGSNKLKTLDVTKNTKLENFHCANNQLTSLNVTKNTKLWRLVCTTNQLTKLDVSKNTLLTEFRCNENKLTSLLVTNNKKLKTLECCNNQIKADAMDKLVKSMPTVSGDPGVFIPFNMTTDNNVITSKQVNDAKAKNWNVQAVKDGSYVDYVPSGIEEVNMDIVTDDRYYTIDGKLVDGVPTKKGIYIHGGKKVVVR